MTPAKRSLAFASLADVEAEVIRLRDGGYERLGKWSLEQMCFHMKAPVPVPLVAPPSDPPPVPDPQLLRRFQHYADHNAPLPGIVAPPGTEPPADAGPGEIEELFERLRAAEAFEGEFVDLRHRGPVPAGLFLAFLRGHCAHHLSLLVPRE